MLTYINGNIVLKQFRNRLILFFLFWAFTNCENQTQVYLNPYFVIKEISEYEYGKVYHCQGPLGNIIIYSDKKYLVGDTLILTQKFTKTKQ